MLKKELAPAVALAREAGKRILEHSATNFCPEKKLSVDNYYEPVTIADKESSKMIVNGIAAAFPNDAILSEEETDDVERRLSADRIWIIDPLDGTAGYVKHDGDFGVQIGLVENKSPVLGVVYLPLPDKLSYATRGGGSFIIIGDGKPIKARASSRTTLSEMTLAMSRDHKSPRMKRIIEHFGFANVVNRGSVGLKVGLIADQTCDIYIHPSPQTKVWDTCAPQLILEEAGGRFTDMYGGELVYNRTELQNLNGILATNGAAHEAAIKHLQPLLAEFGRVRVS